MAVFPILAAALAFACALTLLADYLRRARPDKFVWVIAFAMFGLAAASKAVADVSGWSPLLARGYYVFGATLVVGYLALGELYLLLPRRWADRAAGVTAALTALIAGGTLVVASGGTLTRFGSEQYFYIAMALGVGLIFAGYLRARGPESSRLRRSARWALRRDYRGVVWCGRRPAARPYRRRAAELRAAGNQAARQAAARSPRSLPRSGPGRSG